MNKYITVFDALNLIAYAAEVSVDDLEAELSKTEYEQSEQVKRANEPKLWQPHVFSNLFRRVAKQSLAGIQLAAAIHNSSETARALRWYEMTSTGYPKWDDGVAAGAIEVITDISQGYRRAHQDYRGGQLTRNNLRFNRANETRLKLVCFERKALLALLEDEEIEYSKPAGTDLDTVSNQEHVGITSGSASDKLIGIAEISSNSAGALDSNVSGNSLSTLVKLASDDIPDHSGITFDEFWDREYESIANKRERWSAADLNQLLWTNITKIASAKEAASRPIFFPTAFLGGDKLHYMGSGKPWLTISASAKRVRARLLASNKLISK